MSFDPIDPTKLAALRAIRRPQVFELVAVYWPSGTIYYCSTQLDELPQYSGSIGIIEARLPAYLFHEISHISDIGDDSVTLDFADLDQGISERFFTHGEGVKVEIFYYFPQVDLLVSQWWGHLRPPDTCDGERFVARAQSGFRSALMPLPRRMLDVRCSALWGGFLDTLAQSAENDCPYNRQITGGVTGNLTGGLPFPTCSKDRGACIARLGDALSFLGFDTVVESIVNGQTKGPALLATSRGNETNLKRPLRVVYGHRIVRDLDLLAYTPQLNTKHPDQGYVRCLFAGSEGTISQMLSCRVNGALIGFDHLNVRLGELRQVPTGFSPNVSNYSGTSHFFGVYGPVNAAQYGPSNLQGEAEVYGLNTVRVYTDATTYTKQYTTNRAWCLLDLLTNKRYGHGISFSRFVIEDWIDLAAWCDETVGYSDADGVHYTGTRSTFNAEINEGSAQQHITDICEAGRFGLPFRHEGKVRIVPLRKETIADGMPVFTDAGQSRNIVLSGNKSSLSWSQKSDADIKNQWVVTFDDAAHNNVERPLTFEDQLAQLAAGRAGGDDSMRIVKDQRSLVGVTNVGEAIRAGNFLLDVGPFDSGGLRNNLTIKFLTWDLGTALGLRKYQLIKVRSTKITRFGFEYFRVMERTRKSDLTVEIMAQAYPQEYYERMEDSTQTPVITGTGGGTNTGGGLGDIPCPVGFTLLQHLRDRFEFTLENC